VLQQLDDYSLANRIRLGWAFVLDSEGPQTADQVITDRTPTCLFFDPFKPLVEPSKALVEKGSELRNVLIQSSGIDLRREVLSKKVQRTRVMEGYSIDVVRLEIFAGLYLPVNVYVPTGVSTHQAPLVIAPPGCDSATWSEYVQSLAANLALLRMTVVVPEGFCNNGARAALPDSNANIGYSRELMGLSGDVGIFLQELISTITWAINTYEIVDPTRIGAAGFSYGGQMAMLLAQVDTRVSSLSVPATLIGTSCADFKLNSDINLEAINPDIVWSAPLEAAISPVNSRLVMIYPRAFHTTSGELDTSAPPSLIGPAMDYAHQLYALGGIEDQLLYLTDSGDHNYGQDRREDTYKWFAHTLLGQPLQPHEEVEVPLLSSTDLAVDIAGTKTLTEQLNDTVDSDLAQRFRNGNPIGDVVERVGTAMSELFEGFSPEPLTGSQAWQTAFGWVNIKAYRFSGRDYSFPAFVFEDTTKLHCSEVLYLPKKGTFQEIDQILQLLAGGRIVISIDFLGIGELKSDRILLHTFTRYFMNDPVTLPRMNVDLLRSYLAMSSAGPREIYGKGWVSSMYSLFLKWLDPEKLGNVHLSGVPTSEFDYLKSGQKIPDLLLWEDLFSKLSAAELAASLDPTGIIWK
jgi:dienelactone hydrolase